MAYRRITRSLSKSLDQPINSSVKNKKLRNKTSNSQPQDQAMAMNMEFSCEQLEAALNPDADFLPACFQSQPRASAPSSQQSDGLGSDLQAADTLPPDFSWKFSCDSTGSFSTQLEMVNGIDQILETSSLLYSPVSVAPSPLAPVSPARPKTSAEELLDFYLPSDDDPSSVIDDENNHITDEDLLEDLDDILSSYVEPAEDSLPNVTITYNHPADTFALAMSSQYVEGINVYVQPSQGEADAKETDEQAGLSRRGKPVASKSAPEPVGKRGRKRKMSIDSDSGEDRKKRQNAEAAKNYRKRKAEQMKEVFAEKEQVEQELEKARKRLSAKMNERNILLKMLYESYSESGQPAPHKILFPPWIETWYQKQKDD